MICASHFSKAWGPPLFESTLRATPETFTVIEHLGFTPDAGGEHVFVQVRKTGANTGWVGTQLARSVGISERDVSWSGRKDRHAVCEQWFSLRVPGLAMPEIGTIEGVEVLACTRHNKKLRRGQHESNEFRIILTGGAASVAPGALDERLDRIAEDGVPNYFGEQRFGIDRENLNQVQALFNGQKTDRRKRGIYLSAARAWLFNCELSGQVESGAWLTSDAYAWLPGSMRRGELAVEPGFEAWVEGLAGFGVKAMRRPSRVIPEGLHWSTAGDDLMLGFTLPSGSYATALIREICRYNGGLPEEDQELG